MILLHSVWCQWKTATWSSEGQLAVAWKLQGMPQYYIWPQEPLLSCSHWATGVFTVFITFSYDSGNFVKYFVIYGNSKTCSQLYCYEAFLCWWYVFHYPCSETLNILHWKFSSSVEHGTHSSLSSQAWSFRSVFLSWNQTLHCCDTTCDLMLKSL